MPTYHWSLLSLPEIQTDLLWFLTMVSCGLGLLYFVFVFIIRNKLSRKAQKVAEKKKELAPLVSQFLFFEQTAPVEEKKDYLHSKVEIRELIKSDFNRLVLAEILFDLQKDVSGETRENLYALYKGLGLHHDAFEKLRSRRWEVISQGILELTQMRVEESYMFIRRFINHRRGVIRQQAQIATVTLKNEGIAYFLDTCKHRISEWQQLKLLDVLRNFDDFVPPRFKIWLTSKNKDVVLFALRLIRYYNQNDANRAVIQLIKHRNNQIKTEAVQCLKEFGVMEARDTIKAAFRKSNAGVKIAMLDALAEFGACDDLAFLMKVEHSDDNFTVRSKAMSAINTLAPEKIMPTDDIREPSSADIAFALVAKPEDIESVEIHPDPIPESKEAVIQDNQPENTKPDNLIPGENEPEEELQPEVVLLEESESKEEQQQDHASIIMEEDFEVPELKDENQVLFDLCVKEEFNDIIDEAKQEEVPQYLPLNFLPLVETEPEMEAMEMENTKNSITNAKPVEEEEKFEQDLNSIINKLEMNDESNKPKIREQVPDFIPLVVENQEENEKSDVDTSIREMEVTTEIVFSGAQHGDGAVPDHNSQAVVDLRDTEVIAEEVSWQQLLVENDIDLQISPDEEIEIEDVQQDDFPVFSIFREMFRDFDSESKLILLDEILVVGEHKEWCFLATLSNDKDKRVRKKALKIRHELADKLGIKLDSTTITKESEPKTATHNKLVTDSRASEMEKKLPLEYCFFEGQLAIYEDQRALEPALNQQNGSGKTGDLPLQGES